VSTREFATGDIVNITITGARVQHFEDNTVEYEHPTDLGTVEGCVPLDSAAVTVERIVSAEWPPRAGDLWRDKHGELWFIHKAAYQGQANRDLMGRTTGGARWTDDVDLLLADNAPLTLVHREDAS
jgi:hypothetical protein